jgi:hypothetical protein
VVYYLSHAPSPFYFSYFFNIYFHFCLGWPLTKIFLFILSLAGITNVYHHTQFID